MAADTALARLARLADTPEGLIAHRTGPHGQIAVARVGPDIVMAFCPLGVPLSNDALSGVMARVDPARPLLLKGLYTQAMLAALALAPTPRRAYVMGAGGGRLPLVLRHVARIPEVSGSELDPDVLELSEQFLGFENGPGLQIDCAEGRAHLAAQDAGFDLILIDCFSAQGCVPPALATSEFFALVRGHLSATGVAAINLVDHDPLFAAQRAGFCAAFPHVRAWEQGGSVVLFGGAGGTAPGLGAGIDYGFDLAAHVAALRAVPTFVPSTPPLRDVDIFDVTQTATWFPPGSFDNIRRNAPCPCGSGRKFKACHGRR